MTDTDQLVHFLHAVRLVDLFVRDDHQRHEQVDGYDGHGEVDDAEEDTRTEGMAWHGSGIVEVHIEGVYCQRPRASHAHQSDFLTDRSTN